MSPSSGALTVTVWGSSQFEALKLAEKSNGSSLNGLVGSIPLTSTPTVLRGGLCSTIVKLPLPPSGIVSDAGAITMPAVSLSVTATMAAEGLPCR